MTHFRDGFQQLTPEFPPVFWSPLQNGEGVRSQLLSTALFIHSLTQEMSTECLLHTWHSRDTVDTEMTRVKVSVLWRWLSVGKMWIKQSIYTVAGLVCEGNPLACILGVCGIQLPASPGGTELRAAFPGKTFTFQNFPSWLLTTSQWSHVSLPAGPAHCLPGCWLFPNSFGEH